MADLQKVPRVAFNHFLPNRNEIEFDVHPYKDLSPILHALRSFVSLSVEFSGFHSTNILMHRVRSLEVKIVTSIACIAIVCFVVRGIFWISFN